MQVALSTLLLVTALFAAPAQSAEILTSELPTFSPEGRANLGPLGVGYACLTMPDLKDSLPCNPAMIGVERSSSLLAQVGIGNGYESIKNTQLLLGGASSKELLRSLFAQNQVLASDANAEIIFLTKGLAASFNPYRVSYFSVVRNSAYPVLAVHAMHERSMTLQSGMQIQPWLYAGLQLRSLQRKFVHQEVAVYEALTEGSGSLLKPNEQTATFIEPGVFLEAPTRWKPRLSAQIVNLGTVDKKYRELDTEPAGQLGIGCSPPMKWGRLQLGIDYKPVRDQDVVGSLSAGISYGIGAMQMVAGTNRDRASLGVLYGVSSMQAGIVYATTKVITGDANNVYSNSVLTQFGFQI